MLSSGVGCVASCRRHRRLIWTRAMKGWVGCAPFTSTSSKNLGATASSRAPFAGGVRRAKTPKMADAIFLRLNQKFALGADDLQWILYKSRRKEPSPLEAHLVFGRGGEWEPVSFVSSTKEILFRCMREADCKPCDEAQVALERYPDTFRDWEAPGTPGTPRQ
jgi:hypothetical protein